MTVIISIQIEESDPPESDVHGEDQGRGERCHDGVTTAPAPQTFAPARYGPSVVGSLYTLRAS